MKKLILFLVIISSNFILHADDDTSTSQICNNNNDDDDDENEETITKTQTVEYVVLKILQEENARLAKELQNIEHSKWFVHSIIFGIGSITGLLLGILIHYKLVLDTTYVITDQTSNFIQRITEIYNTLHAKDNNNKIERVS